MPGLRDIKRRITSIQSTRKITRAMQMVSAAKMRKAQNATLASRTYSTLAWELIMNLSKKIDLRPALFLTHPNAKKMAVLILTTNRGQVGSLNSNLVAGVQKYIKQSGLEAEIIVQGKKGHEAVARSHQTVLAEFEKYDRTLTAEDVYPIARLVTDLYTSGNYQKIVIAYNHFVSTLAQKPMYKQILPFAESMLEKYSAEEIENQEGTEQGYGYLFEPNMKKVFTRLLPRIIESQIYQAILENEASEQSARMVMMKNATEAAEDLISDFTLTYNKIRQAKITTELAEITAGKIALE